MTIAYSDCGCSDNRLQRQYFVPKTTTLYWKSSDRVKIGNSDTFANASCVTVTEVYIEYSIGS